MRRGRGDNRQTVAAGSSGEPTSSRIRRDSSLPGRQRDAWALADALPASAQWITAGADPDADIYNGADPTTAPIYSIGEVAHCVRIPPSTVRAWVKNRGGSAPFRRVIMPDDGAGTRLSFRNLIEVHVLSSIRGQGIALPRVREAIGFMRDFYGTAHPLADNQLHTDKADLFVKYFGAVLSVTKGGQAAIGPIVERYLERIERDEKGLLQRLHPFVDGDSRHVVAIDPRRKFGRPYLVHAGVETSAVASRYLAGDGGKRWCLAGWSTGSYKASWGGSARRPSMQTRSSE